MSVTLDKGRIISGNKSRYYHFGPQGETRQLTDASGSITNTYLYTAYGVPVTSTGTDPNPHRYGGKVGYYSDGSLGLMLATQRWYSPNLMRWMGRDPIEYAGGENMYAYVNGNPIRYTDSSGLDPNCTCPPFPSGSLTIDCSCVGKPMGVIPEKPGLPFIENPKCDTNYDADGFKCAAGTIKISDMTCNVVKCENGVIKIDTCINPLGEYWGALPPYNVPDGHFGGPPKEPRPDQLLTPVRPH